jgi:uncharacterized protein YggE
MKRVAAVISSHLQFTVSNPDSIEDVARRLAVEDARRRWRCPLSFVAGWN